MPSEVPLQQLIFYGVNVVKLSKNDQMMVGSACVALFPQSKCIIHMYFMHIILFALFPYVINHYICQI